MRECEVPLMDESVYVYDVEPGPFDFVTAIMTKIYNSKPFEIGTVRRAHPERGWSRYLCQRRVRRLGVSSRPQRHFCDLGRLSKTILDALRGALDTLGCSEDVGETSRISTNPAQSDGRKFDSDVEAAGEQTARTHQPLR